MITPSLDAFSIASAIMLPTSLSPAEIAATSAICALPSSSRLIPWISSTANLVALFMPFLKIIGFAPAATFFRPSRIIACASTVAVVVPSPATSLVLVATSLTSCAPRFSKESSNSISLAIVTPSLVISGVPNFLSKTTFLPLGPSVTLTVSANLLTPASSAVLASAPNLISFAILLSSCFYVIPFSRTYRLFSGRQPGHAGKVNMLSSAFQSFGPVLL